LKQNKLVSFHVDVDSPLILSRFYGFKSISYDLQMLERFYEKTFERAFQLFDTYGIRATFFCVGEEIAKSKILAALLKKACDKGHAIANHTYTHPFGINTLSAAEIRTEIVKCNEAILNATSVNPIGFRAPGYAIDTKVINILEECGIRYDSSAGWPVFHLLFKSVKFIQSFTANPKMAVGYGETNSYFRNSPYAPDRINWKLKSREKRTISEIPLPTSFQVFPYYANFHLSLPESAGSVLINNSSNPFLVYLFHIIEFSSSQSECLPREIFRHPHIHVPVEKKITRFSGTIETLLKNREQLQTEQFILNE